MRLRQLAALSACALFVVGCYDTPSAPSGISIDSITIDSVDVLVLESAPPQVSAHVTGILGDGCSELNGVEQRREGNTVTVTITRKRPTDAICTQIAKLYDATIKLDGAFPAGSYLLKVNAVEKPFTTR